MAGRAEAVGEVAVEGRDPGGQRRERGGDGVDLHLPQPPRHGGGPGMGERVGRDNVDRRGGEAEGLSFGNGES